MYIVRTVDVGFIQTKPMQDDETWLPCMTWDEVRELRDAGWQIGAHTHSHPNLSKLSLEDADGSKMRAELDLNVSILEEQLDIEIKDFAFTGVSYSAQAAREVRKRFRFGRLWIVGSEYQVDGETVRHAAQAP